MKERRSLIEGLAATESRDVEAHFVYGNKSRTEPIEVVNPDPTPAVSPQNDLKVDEETHTGVLPFMKGRIPVTTRCRPEVASALKRASLQRQLAGVEPFYVQDIVESAIETWLRTNGFPV